MVCGNRQRPGYDFDESYSPVACPQAVKLFNCAVARKKLKVRQFDIITAYLNAEIDNRRILMKMPPGYTKTGVAWVLKRALYSLRQAGCLWHQTFKDCLMKLGWKPFPTDPCVFSRNDCFIIIYVDDAQVASESDTLNDTIVSEIARSFNLKDLGAPEKFLGCMLDQMPDGRYFLHQKPYIDELLHLENLVHASPCVIPAHPGHPVCSRTIPEETDTEKLDIAAIARITTLVGKLSWLASRTRPDISFIVGRLQRRTKCPDTNILNAIKHTLRYLAGTKETGIPFLHDDTGLIGWVDASHADNPDGKSTFGYIFFFGGTPVSWISKKQSVVARSSTVAEYIAYESAATEGLFLRQLLHSFGLMDERETILIYTDSDGAFQNVHNTGYSNSVKHIDVRYHATRDLVKSGDVEFKLIDTGSNVADMLTKALLPEKFGKFFDALHLDKLSLIRK